MYLFAKEIAERRGETGEEFSYIDKWLLSRLYKAVKQYDEYMENFELRKAGILLYQLLDDLKWYRRRGGNNIRVLEEF